MAVLPVTPAPTPSRNVATYLYDHYQSGMNPNETALTPANVKTGFGLLFSCEIDGQAYAQPLYLASVPIAGQPRNVVYVATCHDSVYAFDADKGGVPLWHVSFISPAVGKNITPVPNGDLRTGDVVPEVGILSTPVIDEKTGTLYVVAKTKETGRPDGRTHYVQKIHALDVVTGAEKFGGPKVIGDASFDQGKYDFNLAANPQTPFVKGTARDAIAGKVYFNALRNNQRCSLTLSNGVVYVGWSSHGDNDPYHGWLIGFNAATLLPIPSQILCSTPDGMKGGIWQAGAGPAIDNAGNLFIAIANAPAPYNANVKPGNVGESILKFDPRAGLSVAAAGFDFFAPHNAQDLGNGDTGVGMGGTLLVDVPGPNPHLAIEGAKNGVVYIVNRDKMGGYDPKEDRNVQNLEPQGGNWICSAPVFFNNFLYYVRSGAELKCVPLENGKFGATKGTAKGSGGRGGGPVVSANGTANGILWLIGNGAPASLIAYSTDELAKGNGPVEPIYTGRMPSGGVKFTHPIVINGKVYACSANARPGGTTAHLNIFGLTAQKP
ncbi:MAG: hypothetical protein ACREKL_10660 [Chthoniobacterales bacterium]